jgi:hypothetical protein
MKKGILLFIVCLHFVASYSLFKNFVDKIKNTVITNKNDDSDDVNYVYDVIWDAGEVPWEVAEYEEWDNSSLAKIIVNKKNITYLKDKIDELYDENKDLINSIQEKVYSKDEILSLINNDFPENIDLTNTINPEELLLGTIIGTVIGKLIYDSKLDIVENIKYNKISESDPIVNSILNKEKLKKKLKILKTIIVFILFYVRGIKSTF